MDLKIIIFLIFLGIFGVGTYLNFLIVGVSKTYHFPKMENYLFVDPSYMALPVVLKVHASRTLFLTISV